jgi:cytochrome c-type biogenesis protein
MGATATYFGQMLADRAGVIARVGGLLLIVLGLHMTGLFKIRALYSEHRIHARFARMGGLTAFLIGVTFAFGWTPCIGPALAAILALAASSDTVYRGMLLLAVYSLGLGVPFLAAGFAAGSILKALMRFKRHFRKVEIASGVLIVLVGVLIFTGRFDVITALLATGR